MREHLQPWYDRWREAHDDTELLYARDARGEPMLPQVHFVRDYLATLFWRGVPRAQRAVATPREDCTETAWVIGEHTSKSVRLPVYSLERPDLGLQVVLRENFHDWNLSIISERPIETDLRGFPLDFGRNAEEYIAKRPFEPGQYWGYCFFQGFPEELRFGPYLFDQRRFSTYLVTDYQVYTFLWLILRDLRDLRSAL